MTDHNQIRQEILATAMQHMGLDPKVKYQQLMIPMPLESEERQHYTHKVYVQIDGRSILVYRDGSGLYTTQDETPGMGPFLVPHI